MGKNNFEKQVQEKMAELNIQPSEKTWAGIESRIGKKSSRRKILWFLLPGLFLLAGGAYLFLIDGKGNDQKISQLPKQNTETIIQKKEIIQRILDDSIIATIPTELSENKEVSTRSTNKTTDSKSISSKSISHWQHTPAKTNPKNLNENEKANFIIESKDDLIKEQKHAKEISALNVLDQTNKIAIVPDLDSVAGSSAVLSQKEKDTALGNKTIFTESLTDTQQKNPGKRAETTISESTDFNKILNEGGHKKASNSPFNKNWKIGFSYSVARGYIGDGIHLGPELEKSYSSLDPNYSYNIPSYSPGNNFGQASIESASSPKNSIGFNAGIILKKEITPKTFFTTGLNYTYYTNSIMIGNQLPGGNYSSAGMLSSYRNNFHFLELPAIMQFQVIKSHKFPLNFSTGFTIRQLLASDAVQYKSGIYEVDNSLFNKTQFGFSAGVTATFFKKMSVGPYYNYGINSLAKDGFYGKKHLNFLGVKADFIFQKNK
jgi:hypothetical protein